MGVYAVYFSATGNTEKSVKAMAGAIASEYHVYDCTCYKETSGLNKYISKDELHILHPNPMPMSLHDVTKHKYCYHRISH